MHTVLIAIPCLLNGGTEWQTLRLVEALQAGGYHTLTVCYFEYDYSMVQHFKEVGSHVVCLSAYGKRPTGLRATYRFLLDGFRRILKDYHPVVAHIQYMAPGALPILILKRLGIKTLVATLHTDADIYKSLRLIHYLQCHQIHVFTCVSTEAEQHFFGTSQIFESNTKLKKHDHFTIPNCLPNGYAVMKSGRKLNTQAPVIGMVARLEKIKGTDLILEQFAQLLQQCPESILMIVGDGKLRSNMEQQQQRLQINSERVKWMGRIEPQQLSKYYEQMDLLWAPSRSEGFGLVAVEAQAHSIPVIATKVGGFRAIIHNNIDGILTESTNFAKETMRLMQSPEIYASLQMAALRNAESYTFDRYVQRIQALYSQLITHPKNNRT